MIKEDETEPHLAERPVHRVSRAAWPLNVRRVVETGKAAQRRRDWIIQRRWLVALADVLPRRWLLVLATLLVVVSSLLVAALGLRFWYVLLVPLLLFGLLLVLPAFLASKTPPEGTTANLTPFTQELRSSTGLLSLYAQEWRSSPGFLQELRSNPGFLQELKSGSGFLQDLKSNMGFLQDVRSDQGTFATTATPMPVAPEAPLVRVLETYDLRQEQARRFLTETPETETSKHARLRLPGNDAWLARPATERLETDKLADDSVGEEGEKTHKLSRDERATEDGSEE